jgi:hypothetical protein
MGQGCERVDRLNEVKGQVRLPDRKKRASQCLLGRKAACSDMIGRQTY